MSPIKTDSPLDHLPPPPTVHRHMGQLYRQLALLRRLLRLTQAARQERAIESGERQEVRSGE